MEIDAPGEFAALKEQYQRELESSGNSFENFDFPFDRQVMERMLNLSPPGLDEIMALMRVMEFLEKGRYDVFILDTLPPGISSASWNYRNSLTSGLRPFWIAPEVSFDLPVSRSLPAIGENFPRPETPEKPVAVSVRAALYAVTILTEMAFQETSDLLASAGAWGCRCRCCFSTWPPRPGIVPCAPPSTAGRGSSRTSSGIPSRPAIKPSSIARANPGA